MKKFIIIGLALTLLLLLAGCSARSDMDLETRNRFVVDASDYWEVILYNGYKCISVDKTKDDDGKYTVVLVFDKLQK